MMERVRRIIEIIEQHMEILRKKYLVQEIGVFGSCVRGEEREDSDIDILVEFKEPVDFFHFLDLEEYLTSILGKKVDLVMKRALKPEIGKRILEEVIYV